MLSKYRVMAVTIAIAVMTLGYANPSFADKPIGGEHNHGGDDDGRDKTFYDVVIGESGYGETIFGESTRPWSTFGKGKSIGLGDGSLGHTGVGKFTDLSFFTSLKGLFGDIEDVGDIPNGAKCFPLDDKNILVKTLIHQGSVTQGRGGRAESRFFFDGFTFENNVPVLYQLQLFGLFDETEAWPPGTAGHTHVIMKDWVLSVANEGQAIKSISCIGEGETFVTITVTGPL